MSIVSLVLRIHPHTRAAAEAHLLAFPGVECHGMSADGKLVVTVEDTPHAAMSDTLIAIHRVPEVLAATLAYEHSNTVYTPLSASALSEETQS
ncbi:hypothetical protein DLREEDagrD3_06750 [Denitratisoma sp. agr-D3]